MAGVNHDFSFSISVNLASRLVWHIQQTSCRLSLAIIVEQKQCSQAPMFDLGQGCIPEICFGLSMASTSFQNRGRRREFRFTRMGCP